MLEFLSDEARAKLREAQSITSWSDWEKRQIIASRPLYGIDLLPDPTIVWWGLWLPGYSEDPPQITPLLSARSKVAPPTGLDFWKPKVRYSTRHEWFRENWGIELKETDVTLPWDPQTVRELDLALHLMPEAARGVTSASRYSVDSYYDPILQRLIIGSDPNLNKCVIVLADALVLKVLRVGYRDPAGKFHGDVGRTPILRDWLGVEPWRYRSSSGAVLHPGTPEGSAAALAGTGSWIRPASAYDDSDPSASLVWAIALYVLGTKAALQIMGAAVTAFLRDRVFGGDTFELHGVAPEDGSAGAVIPVRHRRTGKVSLA
jgi:hypothetical protein